MLNEILSTDIYRFFLLFTRLGAAMMFMPGFGGQRVPVRFQLLFALALAFLLLPVLGTQIPPLPRRVGDLVVLMMGEALIGIFMGMVLQTIMMALHVAGTFIGFQTGLTNAFSFDFVAEQQSSLLTSFLANLALVAVFATDMHHVMLRAIVDTYAVFPPGQPVPVGEFSEMLSKMASASFNLGIKLAAPLMAFGLIFYAGLGLLSRMVPQMQVFFVALPVQVIAGLWMLMVGLPVMMLVFLRNMDETLAPFLVPR
ncbi:MAG TPA: flagellar biosynthetic protein FliR [Candidatus Omnitrophota bacterium]|nr:flagellar biosynthetic protein FliR [Candidatus Omnitrophota bacterium]